MDSFGVEFGKTIGQLVGEYGATFAWVALFWHVSTLALLYLVLRYSRAFAAYSTLDYLYKLCGAGAPASGALLDQGGQTLYGSGADLVGGEVALQDLLGSRPEGVRERSRARLRPSLQNEAYGRGGPDGQMPWGQFHSLTVRGDR